MIQVIDHYENPRNVGSMDKDDANVGTGLVGAPACGDVMKLQVNESVAWLYLASRDYFVTICAYDCITAIFCWKNKVNCCNLSAQLVSAIKNWTFVTFKQWLSYNYVIMNMLGGCLPETQSKGIYFISGLKSCRSRLRN